MPAVGANGAGFEFPTHYGVLQGPTRDTGTEPEISGQLLPGYSAWTASKRYSQKKPGVLGIGRWGFMAYAHSVSIRPENSTAPGEDEALCEPRERASAILGIVAAFVLGLCVVLAAILAGGGGGGGLGGGGAGGGAGRGYGSGTGTGMGPGSGTGSGVDGSGPGAGTDANTIGKLADGPDEVAPPPGSPDGVAGVGDSEAADSVALEPPGPKIEPPKFGFTVPDAPPPPPLIIPTSPSVAAPGIPTGRPTRGGAGAAGGTGSEFMGVKSAEINVVYVIDSSGSMDGERFTHAKLELKRSIERLPSNGSFALLFFNQFYNVVPPGHLIPANTANKAAAKQWIDKQGAEGGTDPTDAMVFALRLKPGAIFLMTDGVFVNHQNTFNEIKRNNPDSKTSVSTIAFHERAAEQDLKAIAAANRGDYRYVPPPRAAPVP